jgi:hypothetical protein
MNGRMKEVRRLKEGDRQRGRNKRRRKGSKGERRT